MKTVSKIELEARVKLVAPNARVFSADRAYALATLGYLLGAFYRWFKDEMFRVVGNEWNKRFDCDDFARFFAAWAALANRIADKAEGHPEGLAVGECWFKQDSGGGHAINIALTEIDEALAVVFIEPQNGKRLALSQSECHSIFYVRF